MKDRDPSDSPVPVGELTYTDASRELDEIVAFFEQRDVDVDQLVARLERGTAIVDELDQRIRRTRAQVEQLVPRLSTVSRGTEPDLGAGESSEIPRVGGGTARSDVGDADARRYPEADEVKDDDADEDDEVWEAEAIDEDDLEEHLDAWDDDQDEGEDEDVDERSEAERPLF